MLHKPVYRRLNWGLITLLSSCTDSAAAAHRPAGGRGRDRPGDRPRNDRGRAGVLLRDDLGHLLRLGPMLKVRCTSALALDQSYKLVIGPDGQLHANSQSSSLQSQNRRVLWWASKVQIQWPCSKAGNWQANFRLCALQQVLSTRV